MSEEIARTEKGTFVKGRSPNPGGRSAKVREVQELARGYTVEAIEGLVDIARSPKAASMARVRAWEVVLERAYGKVGTAVMEGTAEGLPTLGAGLMRFREVFPGTSIGEESHFVLSPKTQTALPPVDVEVVQEELGALESAFENSLEGPFTLTNLTHAVQIQRRAEELAKQIDGAE